jgi:hypothetical protein
MRRSCSGAVAPSYARRRRRSRASAIVASRSRQAASGACTASVNPARTPPAPRNAAPSVARTAAGFMPRFRDTDSTIMFPKASISACRAASAGSDRRGRSAHDPTGTCSGASESSCSIEIEGSGMAGTGQRTHPKGCVLSVRNPPPSCRSDRMDMSGFCPVCPTVDSASARGEGAQTMPLLAATRPLPFKSVNARRNTRSRLSRLSAVDTRWSSHALRQAASATVICPVGCRMPLLAKIAQDGQNLNRCPRQLVRTLCAGGHL